MRILEVIHQTSVSEFMRFLWSNYLSLPHKYWYWRFQIVRRTEEFVFGVWMHLKWSLLNVSSRLSTEINRLGSWGILLTWCFEFHTYNINAIAAEFFCQSYLPFASSSGLWENRFLIKLTRAFYCPNRTLCSANPGLANHSETNPWSPHLKYE